LMPAWVGKQNPAAKASKIYSHNEGINYCPFSIIFSAI
jgi:hypothetical protein